MSASSWIHIGLHGDYHWLEVEGEAHIWWLVRSFPELFHDRFIAATSLSGSTQLSDAEAGWTVRNGIAYSPKLSDGLPRYAVEEPPSVFDEWYAFDESKELGERIDGGVFDTPPSPGRAMVFCNWLVLRLGDSQDESAAFLRDWFWQQLEWIQPEAFVTEAPGCLILVSKDPELMERVSDYLYDIAS